jgi:COP9 signalosome complex subunit 5
MGLCIGKPEGDCVVVTDTWPLPVEGTETKVVADDAQTYMTQLVDSMELRRKDRFVGWYHSHPFDVTTYSHCHLSATDVQTQFMWQSQIPHWVAIVCDPLRSLARQEPEFGCFRCYPVNHTPPKVRARPPVRSCVRVFRERGCRIVSRSSHAAAQNESPDGSVSENEQARVVRWGVTHNRYYSMAISYFMSTLGSQVLGIMSNSSLWIRVLSSSAIIQQENRERFSDRVKNAASKVESASQSLSRRGERAASPCVAAPLRALTWSQALWQRPAQTAPRSWPRRRRPWRSSRSSRSRATCRRFPRTCSSTASRP